MMVEPELPEPEPLPCWYPASETVYRKSGTRLDPIVPRSAS